MKCTNPFLSHPTCDGEFATFTRKKNTLECKKCGFRTSGELPKSAEPAKLAEAPKKKTTTTPTEEN